jgi:hypothetical protein
MRTIEDTQAVKALRHAQIRAHRQWQRDGQRCDLSEYLDAAMAAIAGCLARYDPTRGIQFKSYAEYRINGGLRDAAKTYTTWRRGGSRGTRTKAAPNAEVLRPLQGRQGDPIAVRWLMRQISTLSRCDGQLLQQLLVGDELTDIAEREAVAYLTVYM